MILALLLLLAQVDAPESHDLCTVVKDVSTCLDAAPKLEDDGKKRTARLHKGGVPVRATFTRGTECQFRFFVEPLSNK